MLTNNIAWILRRMPIFALPGTAPIRCSRCTSMISRGSATEAGGAHGDVVIDAAGPETMSFRDS